MKKILNVESITRIPKNGEAFFCRESTASREKATVSVVTSLFNSARYVEEFYHRILAQLQKINCEYEVVFVDDGSPDQSLEVALEIAQRDPKATSRDRSEEHTSELQSHLNLVCRLLLEK